MTSLAGVELCCPHCRAELEEVGSDSSLSCSACNRQYPIILGIPDLRVFPDPYIDIEADREKALRVAEHLDGTTFVELVEYYYSITSVVPPQHARQYARGLAAAEVRARAALQAWERMAGSGEAAQAANFLDIGCGTAPLLVAAAPHYANSIGVDIAFRWLVVAKKRLSEAGLDVPLICACAEALPFPHAVFDRVAGESVLENTRDQRRSLSEVYRVLRPGGRLYLSTPNRYSLGPDQQTGIWAAGYLPKRWVDSRVQRQGGIPPKRNLLSARTATRIIDSAGFTEMTVQLPDIPDEQRKYLGTGLKFLIAVYHFTKRFPLLKGSLLWIGPLLQIVARKPKARDA